MMHSEDVQSVGKLSCKIEYSNGKSYELMMPNTVVSKGREALAAVITNTFASCPVDSAAFLSSNVTPSLYINRMLFGNNGVDGSSVPKRVVASQNTLYCGVPLATKNVSAIVNPNVATQAIFTSVLLYSDANGVALSEMALQMTNNNLYSMITFPPITKTNQMQISFSWSINFV